MSNRLQPFQIGLEVIDNFDDSSIHERWTVEEPGDATVVEGSDGIVLTMPPGSSNSPVMYMDLPTGMVNRNWLIQLHVNLVLGSQQNAGGLYFQVRGKGGGSASLEKYFTLSKNSGFARDLVMSDNSGSVNKAITGDDLWMRMRRFGDEVRCDYYIGDETVDVDGDGYWREYDSSKVWNVTPNSDTYNYPVFYEKLKFIVSQWDNNPGFTATLRKFKLQIF
jgi:hypothetical protein